MLIGLAMSTAVGGFYFFFAARGSYEQVRSLVAPAIVIGIFDAVAGFVMSFSWPMTGFGTAYDMLDISMNRSGEKPLKLFYETGLVIGNLLKNYAPDMESLSRLSEKLDVGAQVDGYLSDNAATIGNLLKNYA